jgi:hypothetical protein
MRTLAPLALLALIAVTAFASVRLARAEDPIPSGDELQNRRISALERQVAYLRAREAKLTANALRAAGYGDAVLRLVADARANGFATAGNPSVTRERFLAAWEVIGNTLKKDLPVTATEDLVLLEAR